LRCPPEALGAPKLCKIRQKYSSQVEHSQLAVIVAYVYGYICMDASLISAYGAVTPPGNARKKIAALEPFSRLRDIPARQR